MASNTQELPGDSQQTQETLQNPEADVHAAIAGAPEPKLPTRKDTSLREFLSKMDEYAPIVWLFHPSLSSLPEPFRVADSWLS